MDGEGNGWRRGTLSELVVLNGAGWDPRFGGIIKYLDIASIPQTGAVGELREIEAAGAPSRARRKAKAGDTLVSTVRPYLRAFTLLREAPPNLVASTGFAVLTPRATADAEFVFQSVLQDKFVSFLEPRMTGTGYPAVRGEDVVAYPIDIPPPDERARIGSVLRGIDEAIEKTEAVIAATEDVRKALLQELLTRGVPGWHTEWKTVPGIGTVPACWEVVRLGEVLLKIEAGRSPNCESRPAREDEWGVLKVSSVSWDDYLPAENKALPAHAVPDVRFEVRAGDLLMSRANTPSLVGRSVLVEKTRPRLLLCDKTLRLVPDERRASASLINAILSMPYVRKQIEDSGSGTSLSMQNVSQGAIRQLLVVFPPSRRERELIENAATACRNTLARTRTAAGGVRNLKAQAADALLSGRVRMPAVGEVSQ